MFAIYRIAYVTDRRTDRDLDKIKCYDCQANYIRDLTKLRRRGQRQSQKVIGLVSKTTPLHVHHAFLYISLPSLHDYDVKWPNFKFFLRTGTSLRSKLFRLVSEQKETCAIFARSLTLVPRSLLLNRTETLATQASLERQVDKFYHLYLNSNAPPSLQLQHKFPSFK